MGLDDSYQKALADMAGLNPIISASKSGVKFDNGQFIIPLLNRKFSMTFPGMTVTEMDGDAPPPKLISILLMHYLTNADGTPVAGTWIAYRQLPGAHLFGQRFDNLVLGPMLESFGNDVEGFRRSAVAIGGQPMDRSGDAGFRFTVLPRIPMGCILYEGDEDMPSSINVLFDAAAPHYLPTEDLTILGGLLHSALRKHRNITVERGKK